MVACLVSDIQSLIDIIAATPNMICFMITSSHIINTNAPLPRSMLLRFELKNVIFS